jgi:chorismate-pyruvate lyase
MRLGLALGLSGLTLAGNSGFARPVFPWPDTFLARLEALALMQSLNANLLAARSATATLDQWCADHKLASDPKIHARLVRGAEKPVSIEQRARLRIDMDEPVKYRRVELTCGDVILSEADNWYVPSRLTKEMNQILETTDTPFGRAVQDLQPFRRTFSVEIFWKPLPEGWEMNALPLEDHAERALAIPDQLFQHRALVLREDQEPFSEVTETYTSAVLGFGQP